MKENGKFNKVDIYEFGPSNKGVIATDNIDTNELIIFVPLSLCIKSEDVLESEVAKYLIENDNRNPVLQEKTLMYTLLLLEEQRKPDSKWKDYMALLPTDFSMFPLKYTEEEIKLLEGSGMHRNIHTYYKDLKNTYT